jgi:hypothetical protein
MEYLDRSALELKPKETLIRLVLNLQRQIKSTKESLADCKERKLEMIKIVAHHEYTQ